MTASRSSRLGAADAALGVVARRAARAAAAGRRPGSDGWPEITWCALTWKRKSSGVRSAQAAVVSTVGSA